MHQQPFGRSKRQTTGPRLIRSGGGSPAERQDEVLRSGEITSMGFFDTDNPTCAASDTIDDDAELEDIDDHDHDADIQGGTEYASNQASLSKSWSGRTTHDGNTYTRTRSNSPASITIGRSEPLPIRNSVFPLPLPGVSSQAAGNATRETRRSHSVAAHDTPPASLALGLASPLSSVEISPLNSSDVNFELFEAPPGWKSEVDNIATELCGSPRRKKVRNDDVEGNGSRNDPFQRLLEDEPNYPRSPCANRCNKGKGRAVQPQIDDLRRMLDELSKRVAELWENLKDGTTGCAPNLSTEGRATEDNEQDTKSGLRKDDLRSNLRRLETTTLVNSKLLKEDVASLGDGQQRLLTMFESNRRELLKLKRVFLYARLNQNEEDAFAGVDRPGPFHREEPEEPEDREPSLFVRRNASHPDVQFDFPESGHAGPSIGSRMLSPNEDRLDYFSWLWPNTDATASEPAANPRKRKPAVADFAPSPSVHPSRETESTYPGSSLRTESRPLTLTPPLPSRGGGFRIPFCMRADPPESSSTAFKQQHSHDREPLQPLHLTSPAISPRSQGLPPPAEAPDHGMMAQTSPPISPQIQTVLSAVGIPDHEMLSPASPVARPSLEEYGRRESDDFYAGRSNVFPPMTPEWCAHHARTHPHGCDSMVDCMVCRSHGHGGPLL